MPCERKGLKAPVAIYCFAEFVELKKCCVLQSASTGGDTTLPDGVDLDEDGPFSTGTLMASGPGFNEGIVTYPEGVGSPVGALLMIPGFSGGSSSYSTCCCVCIVALSNWRNSACERIENF